ncbi:MAG: glycosyltransferase family 4 protein [Acidobacteriia bacterium]|nr:glycosyltransferase family 4 protein [Terriglobia bacterium]
MMPRRVLLMARELDLGGSERQLTVIAKALDRSRFEALVGCFRPAGLRGQELSAAGVGIAHFPVYSFASPAAASGAWKLARFIRSRGIDLVHTFDYPLTAFAIPVGHFFTRAIVVSSQRAHRGLIPSGYRTLVRATDRLADAIVVNCEFLRRHLEQDEGVASSRIRLCYNGIDLDEFQSGDSSRPAELPADALVIGVVCALRPEKDLPSLLKAFACVRRARAGLKLAIVGGGPLLAALKSQARELAIVDECVFAPATDRVADWLRAIDIFVLPSRSEALSNSLMEAMACGCCAAASNVGGNPELVRNGETGLLFEAGDVADLSARLELLIGNDSLRRRLATAGVQWIRERFSVRSAAQRMGEIYGELLERRAGG